MNEIDRPYNLKRFHLQWQKLNHVYEDYAKIHDLTYISMFILQLLDGEGTTQKELCDILYFPKQTVNKVILSFVKRGYAAMAENPVEFNNCGFEVFLEDIDHHIVCAGAQRIIVELSGDAAHDLVGPAPVAAAGALDAQKLATFKEQFTMSRVKKDGAFEDHVATLLPRRPGIEITHNDRMHQCIEVSQRLRVGKDDAREVSPVELPVAESPLAEATGKLPPQRPILLHQPFGRSVRIVNRNALLCKKAADSALAAADAARNSYFHHSCPSGKSISGTASIEVILISLNFTEIAFCNDCGSMMIRPSCPSSRERLYLSAESGMRSVLFM